MAVLSSTWIILLVPLALLLSVSATPVDHEHHHHSESGDDEHVHHNHDDFSGIGITDCLEDCKDLLEVNNYLSLYMLHTSFIVGL